jgi:long-chain acyl-CoA synthetase
MSVDTEVAADHLRPWVDHYPPGISWDTPLTLSPVHEQVLNACVKTPNAAALDFLGGKTTFRQLGRAITAFAGALQTQLGVKKGTRVALLLPNTPFYVIAYYAILRIGGVVVNCNPLYTIKELTHITENAHADLIVTLDLKLTFDKADALIKAGHCKRAIVCHFPQALPILTGLLYRIAKRHDLADVRHSGIADRVTWYHKLVARRDAPTPVPIDIEKDVAVQQYTGGTTGLPRGALLSHANIAANMAQIDLWGCELFYPPSKVVAVLPFFHIFAMTVCMNVPLCNGTEVVMLPRFELAGFLKLLERTRPNVLPAVPSLIATLAKAGERARPALKSLEVVVSGGAPLSSEIRAAWEKNATARLAEGYGLTEASPVVCCAALRVESKPMSIGLPLPATDIRLVDPDTGKVVGIGERGELQVKGPQVMLGYYNDPDATRGAFDHGWLHSGDVATMDSDGYVFIVDRIKDLIINSGFNVYPRVIEEAVLTHPAVEETTVIGVPDERRGEVPVAFVKLHTGQTVTAEALLEFLDNILNRQEMPREIIFKDALPKTLIGKLSKKELREEYKATKGNHRESA